MSACITEGGSLALRYFRGSRDPPDFEARARGIGAAPPSVLFSGAVARTEGDGSDGVSEIVDARGRVLAHGAYSPDSQILARLWTFDGRVPDAAIFSERFAAARRLREETVGDATTGFRAVHSEGDGCPGVVLDVYGETAVLELLTAGTEAWAAELEKAAGEVFSPRELLLKKSGSTRDRGRGEKPSPPGGGEGRVRGASPSAFPSSRTACAFSRTLGRARRPDSSSTSARTARGFARSLAGRASSISSPTRAPFPWPRSPAARPAPSTSIRPPRPSSSRASTGGRTVSRRRRRTSSRRTSSRTSGAAPPRGSGGTWSSATLRPSPRSGRTWIARREVTRT